MATADGPAYSVKATELKALRPAHVATLVCWLRHEAYNSWAGFYEAGGGFYRRTR